MTCYTGTWPARLGSKRKAVHGCNICSPFTRVLRTRESIPCIPFSFCTAQLATAEFFC